MRSSRIENWINIAKEHAKMSPCSRKKFCAILVKEGVIISMGYNGSCRGSINCGIQCPCLKDLHNEPSYTSYDYCPAVHAEENVIINAARIGVSTIGTILILASAVIDEDKPGEQEKSYKPCPRCKRAVINAGIVKCFYLNKDGIIVEEDIKDWIKQENEWILNRLGRMTDGSNS